MTRKLMGKADPTTDLSSRTRVTELPSTPRYRFFPKARRKMAHANFSQWNTVAPQVFGTASRFRPLLPRLHASASCRHTFPATARHHWRLLLPLRGIQSPRRLRENVRVEEICVPLVGHQLRQASHEHPAPRLSCRPAVSASSPHRTRGTSQVLLDFLPSCLPPLEVWQTVRKLIRDNHGRSRIARTGRRTRSIKKRCQNLGDFEDGAIVLRRNAPPELRQPRRLQHLFHAADHVPKTLQHDANVFLFHPLRVVALLRQRPGIAFDQHGKPPDHGLRDASRSGLANQKISRAHQAMHFFRKPDNVYGHLPFA